MIASVPSKNRQLRPHLRGVSTLSARFTYPTIHIQMSRRRSMDIDWLKEIVHFLVLPSSGLSSAAPPSARYAGSQDAKLSAKNVFRTETVNARSIFTPIGRRLTGANAFVSKSNLQKRRSSLCDLCVLCG